MKKKSSENDQLTGHFQSFFIYFFSSPPTLNLKKKSRKSTNKKILALNLIMYHTTSILLFKPKSRISCAGLCDSKHHMQGSKIVHVRSYLRVEVR